ncbi:ABC transporter substrate-binding protein [Chitinimonas sp.]|uniref:ABC transporter substrate-binding protein n=1 Tax=Chitinimonas sp. TaxID=1934313 RepID=UPI0035B1530D
MKLRLKTAAEMPKVSDDGKVYTFKIKQGIYFADDPAFGGKKRELTAQDYIYSIQRMVDPAHRGAPWDFLYKGKVLGLDEKIAAAKNGKFDYDSPVEGLVALDRYTFQIKLKAPDYNMPYIMAVPANVAVAREVVEKYGDELDAHPVGTGPYKLKLWQRRNRILLEANPNFRGERYEPVAGATGIDPVVHKQLQGKVFPQVGNIDIRIIETPQSAWLAFDDGGLDVMAEFDASYVSVVAPGGKVAQKYLDRGWQYERIAPSAIQVKQFNMEDPVVGGYTPEKVALRRAFALAFNTNKMIWLVKNGQATEANSPLAPSITGFDPNFKNALHEFSPAKGNSLLDLFGYKDCDGDGLRELPGCKPLTITYLTSIGKDDRDDEAMVQKSWALLGIKCEIKKVQFPDLLSARDTGKFQMAVFVWNADYPDAENFMQLLYGPNKGAVNNTRFEHKEFDQLYRQIATMPDSPERNAKLRRMSRIVSAYVPWAYEFHTLYSHVSQPWVQGYKPFPTGFPYFLYTDIDTKKRESILGKRAN